MPTGYAGFNVPGDKYTVLSFDPITGSGIQDVYVAEDRFAILATESGIDIVDLFSGEVSAYAVIPDTEVLSVAVDDATFTGSLYVGTSTSGVLATEWHPLKAPGTDFTNSLTQVYTTTGSLPISDNRINDIDASSFKLMLSTGSGVDFISRPTETPQQIATRLLVSGSNSCQMTNAGGGYWTAVNSGVEVNYDLISTTGGGIIDVDARYDPAIYGPFLPSNRVNDLRISEGTPNIINVATASGDFMIEEVQGAESTARSRRINDGINVVSADFPAGTTFDRGHKYTTTTGVVTVFGFFDTPVTVSGTHYQEIAASDIFSRENTRDQALITGTITVLRTTSIA